MDGDMKAIQTALDIECGDAPKSALEDREVAWYYYTYTVQAMKEDLATVQEERTQEKAMPAPKPKKNEKRKEYVSRFVSNDAMQQEYPDKDQRLAVAYSKWRSHKHSQKKK